MVERGGIVRINRLDRRRLLGLGPAALVTIWGLSACGSSDDDDEGPEDVATRVSAQGAPPPLPTIDPNATPAEDVIGGAASGAVGESATADAQGGGSGGGEAPAGGEVVELASPGISWSTNEITIARGGTIHLINDGSGGPHNFIIEGYNDDAPVDMPAPSEVDWVVPDDVPTGPHTFYCGIPGHRALMEGTITIT
jgi:hypothetical protein